MAKSKHRKAHKQALARWKSVHAPQLPKAGVPVQVAKNAYEVRYPAEEVAAAITVNGKTLEGHVDTARGAITLPDNLTVEKGDRIRMDHTYRLVANPGAVRGRTEHLMTFDDVAHWLGARTADGEAGDAPEPELRRAGASSPGPSGDGGARGQEWQAGVR